MEKIILVKNNDLDRINGMLNDGWKVKHISATNESVAIGGGVYYHNEKGNIYAYIVLEKDS